MRKPTLQQTKQYLRQIFLISSMLLLASFQVFAVPAHATQSQADSEADYNWPLWNPSAGACGSDSGAVPTGTLPKIIPEPYNGAFTQGGNNHKVAPALVAAIFTEENFTHTDTSQLAATWANFPKIHPDPNSGWPSSSAGASGPFQFLPSTWTGLGYNIADINNLVKASDAAADYLASNGGTSDKPPASWQNAIFAYNHAQWYVDAVMEYYNFYTTGKSSTTPPATSTTTTSTCGGGSVSCNGSVPKSAQNLSPTRQKIVCLAQQELALWKAGKMSPGFRPNNPNSFSKYSDNNDELWCADFASWIYNQAGDPLTGGASGGWRVSYVPDIQALGQQNGKFHWHPAGSGYVPKPGDLAIHGSQHVNIFVSASGNTASFIGGDQTAAPAPDGTSVSLDTNNGYYGGYDPAITGYVSPD